MSSAPIPASDTPADRLLLVFSTFHGRTDNQPMQSAQTWGRWARILTTHAHVETKEQAGGWSPAEYKEGATRGKEGVRRVHALVLDIDHGTVPYETLAPFAYSLASTYQHTAEAPRYRVVLPLSRPVDGADWERTWRRADAFFGGVMDPACKDASRWYYYPSCPPQGEPESLIHAGRALDPDELPPLPEPARPARVVAAPVPIDSGRASRYVRSAYEDELRTLAITPNGQRNDQLNKSAFALGRFVGSGHLTDTEVANALEAVCETNGLVDDDGLSSVRATIVSGLNAGKAESWELPPARPYQPYSFDGADDPADSSPPVTGEHEPEHHLTDLGNARRLVQWHGQDLRYVAEWGKWHVWDGCRWAEDRTGEVYRRAKASAERLYRDAGRIEDLDERAAVAKWAIRSESSGALTAAVKVAESEPGIATRADIFDRDPWLLSVQNGTLDLRTGTLRPHRREDYVTHLAPVEYHPDATCPRFLAFLATIFPGGADVIRFVQKGTGYTLTGVTSERVMLVLHGEGRNGKSTFINIFQDLLGDYALGCPKETFLVQRVSAIPNDVAQLRGKRLASTIETNEGERLDEAKVKAMTGGDRLQARFLHGEWFEFEPQFKPWIATNHRPTVREQEQAIWDRLRLIPFLVRIPDDQEDKGLRTALQAELPGILNWALEGCRLWQAEGLKPPSQVSAATDGYRAENDQIGHFLGECCVLLETATAPTKDLYAAYKSWCNEAGEGRPVSSTLFGRFLEKKGFARRHSKHGDVRTGIGLRDREAQEELPVENGEVFSQGEAFSAVSTFFPRSADIGKKGENSPKTLHHPQTLHPDPENTPVDGWETL